MPIVTHRHGGHNDSIHDGLPDQWFTQSGGGNGPRDVGPGFVTSTMTYDNDQQAATLWYHDHALGITRLNVYAGLAGFYVLEDQNRLDLVKQGVLPSGDYDLGMAIQDRAFTSDGQLYYPAYKNDPLPGTDMTVGDVVPQKFYDKFGESAGEALGLTIPASRSRSPTWCCNKRGTAGMRTIIKAFAAVQLFQCGDCGHVDMVEWPDTENAEA